MIISIEFDSAMPLYQQIRDRVVEAIAAGHLTAGDALPSIRQLASDLGINLHTVNKGYDALRAEGLLRLNRKSGAVVLRDQHTGEPPAGFAEEWTTRARTVLAEAIAHGIPATAVIAHCHEIVAGFQEGQA